MTDDRRNPALSWVFSLLLAAAGTAAGLIVTPFAVSFLGRALLAGRPGYAEQSVGLGLFFYGVLAAFPVAVSSGIFALWISGRGPFKQVGRRERSVAASWAFAVAAYGAFILAFILAAWLSFSPGGRPPGWSPGRPSHHTSTLQQSKRYPNPTEQQSP
jgi:hypothetical protein